MKACMFCGSTENTFNEEHIWPLWLTRMFKRGGVKKFFRQKFLGHGKVPREYNKGTIDVVIDAVCEPCNSKWLSELENKVAKPVVSPLINGVKRKLSTYDQLAASTWFLKVAMEYEFTDNNARFFTSDERRHFMDTSLPPDGVSVWLGQYFGPRFVDSFQTLFVATPQGPYDEVLVTTGVVHRLAFQVVGRRRKIKPPPGREPNIQPILETWRDATVQIWPSVVDPAKWPPWASLDEAALTALKDRWGRSFPPLATQAKSTFKLP